jgi:hypothetical protein
MAVVDDADASSPHTGRPPRLTEDGTPSMSRITRMAKPLTPTALGEYANEHLFYEARMFVVARQILSRLPPADVFAKNAIIEVCVLHLRNLIDFLYPVRPRKDDVFATLYVRSPAAWSKGMPEITTDLERARRRANKELAHLTTARIAGNRPEKSWDFKMLSTDLRAAIQSFLRHADLAKLSKTCKDQLEQI